MELDFSVVTQACIAGLLGILWWDIRGIRKSTRQDMNNFRKETKEQEYLTESHHKLLCENATLRFQKIISDMKDEIIREIKSNQNRRKET